MYDRELDDEVLTFGVSGKLYRNSLIMYDRQTGTLWSHLLGAAIDGPGKGRRLEVVPSTFTTWSEWRAAHPDTVALSPAGSPYGSYGDDPYAGYYESSRNGILGTTRRDRRIDDKELVLGVLAPAAKAYAVSDLRRERVIRDTLAGEDVEIVFDESNQVGAAFLLEGRMRTRLPTTPIFWFAWVDFFPAAPLWERDADPLDSGAR